MAERGFLERLHRELMDAGKYVEAGWVSLRLAAIPLDAPALQLEEMQMAFFAGAQHVFHGILTALDADEEPTANDLRRMDLVDQELRSWIEKYKLKHFNAEGTA